MPSNTSYYAGLDIGGTTVKAVLVNHLAEQVGPLAEVRSMVKDGYEATFGQLDSALDQLAAAAGIERSAIAGIGLDQTLYDGKGGLVTFHGGGEIAPGDLHVADLDIRD